jgi:hypothetical protein
MENLNKEDFKGIVNINLQGGISPITEAGNYQLVDATSNSSNNIVIRVDTSVTNGQVNIYLPLSANYSDGTSTNIYIIDTGFLASKYPINIYIKRIETKEQTDTINGTSYVTLQTDGGNICIFCLTKYTYIANGNITLPLA